MSLASFYTPVKKHYRKRSELVGETDREILVMIANGLSTKQMVEQLGLVESTVDSFRVRMYRRIKVRNAPQAVAWGFKNGYLI